MQHVSLQPGNQLCVGQASALRVAIKQSRSAYHARMQHADAYDSSSSIALMAIIQLF